MRQDWVDAGNDPSLQNSIESYFPYYGSFFDWLAYSNQETYSYEKYIPS
jgi:hypothetical protein